MGGKASSGGSDQVVAEQKAEAAQAAQQEAQRQARIQQGLTSIKAAFEGTPITTSQSTPFDWSKFTGAAATAPAGYTPVYAPVKSTGGAASGGGSGPLAQDASGNYARGGAAPLKPGVAIAQDANGNYGSANGAGASAWALKGPDGKIYNKGDPLSITTQTDTGQRTGGFDDSFYNKYKQAVLDYYMPQVSDQYSDAQKELTYRLGRAGTLTSSAANDQVAKLAKQNLLNQAQVYNQADTAAGDLRTQVAGEESKAVSQLYATEDPDIAANQATDAVKNISLQQPNLSPLSTLFNLGTIGGANILKGYNSNQLLNSLGNSLPKDRSIVVGRS